jgi:glycosyltransferase involved in cell wall biosynthesis
MENIKFSILIVSLNAGDDLKKTVSSVLNQNYTNYEIIVKDGLSTDNSIDQLNQNERLSVYRKKDSGIYDAMNQAAEFITGDYAIYLNCGDTFFTTSVLNDVAIEIKKSSAADIYYGDNYTENRSVILRAPRSITDYTCFTRILCHQSTFYSRNILKRKSFDTRYKVTADAYFYISSYKLDKSRIEYIPVVVSSYQGGGFSEAAENKKRGLAEHKQLLKEVFEKDDYFIYRTRQFLTLHLLKQWLSKQVWFEKYYNNIASLVYTVKNRYSSRI